MMKRYVIEQEFGIDELKLVESDIPQPGPGEVLVKMKAASLNYRDLLMVTGSYTRNLPLPLVPLSDGAGEVSAVGPGVRRWKEGDRVIGCFFQCWPAGKITPEVPKTALGGAFPFRGTFPMTRGPRSPAPGSPPGTVSTRRGSPVATRC